MKQSLYETMGISTSVPIEQQIENLRLGTPIPEWITSCELTKQSRRKIADGTSISKTYTSKDNPVWNAEFQFLDDKLISARRCVVKIETNTLLTEEEVYTLFSTPVGTQYKDMPNCIKTGVINPVFVLEENGSWVEREDTFHVVADHICSVFDNGQLVAVKQL